MKITVSSNATGVSKVLRALYRDQIPFATKKALNRTAEDVQAAQRKEMDDNFVLRKKKWARDSIKIGKGDRAKKTKLEAIVRVETPGDPSRSDILTKFEDGGTKRARDGGRLAIPAAIQRTRTGVISKTKRPKSFDFVHVGGSMWKGKKRTFMIKNADGTGGIYQRVGKLGRKKKDGTRKRGEGRRMASHVGTRKVRDMNIRTLYYFTPTARIDQRLRFHEIAEGTVRATFHDNFKEAFAHAVATGLDKKQARRIALADVMDYDRVPRRRR